MSFNQLKTTHAYLNFAKFTDYSSSVFTVKIFNLYLVFNSLMNLVIADLCIIIKSLLRSQNFNFEWKLDRILQERFRYFGYHFLCQKSFTD